MGSATRVFLAHLRGVGVFDPNGDQVGKVRDAVVILRLEPNPPILTGLVVEVQHRRRIFVPMGRVTDIAGGQVLVTGTLNLRRFEKRENETLVAAELLDRQVTLLDTGEASINKRAYNNASFLPASVHEARGPSATPTNTPLGA